VGETATSSMAIMCSFSSGSNELSASGSCRRCAHGLRMTKTWRADFFDDSDHTSPSRSVIIFADSEKEAVAKAAAQMGNAVRVEVIRMISNGAR
jgi:hypothetical protein